MTLVLTKVALCLGRREIVREADFSLEKGEILGVIGPNGAGKSTLLRAAAGLLAPQAGRIDLDGMPIAEWQPRARGRRIAYLPQERTVHWPLSVRAVVALGRVPHHDSAAADSREDREAITRAMVSADVSALADRPVLELSGGERARVLLARALAQEAHILIADEPAAGLDPAHQIDLFDRFRTMAANGRSVLVALHDLSAAARHCHRILLLSAGRPAALGPPHQVLTPELIARAYGISARITDVDGVPVVVPVRRLT